MGGFGAFIIHQPLLLFKGMMSGTLTIRQIFCHLMQFNTNPEMPLQGVSLVLSDFRWNLLINRAIASYTNNLIFNPIL